MPTQGNDHLRAALRFVILGLMWGQAGCYQILKWDESSAGPAKSCEATTFECLNDQTNCCDSFPVAADQVEICPEATVQGFRLDAYEVTVGRFKEFIASKPKSGTTDGDLREQLVNVAISNGGTTPTYLGTDANMPMNYVTLQEAQDFCEWDNGYLATLTELQIAASEKGQKFPWKGDSIDHLHATFGKAAITPVGQTLAGMSCYGQFDLVGNVREWTDGNDPCNKAQSGTQSIVFGGSFLDTETGLQQGSRSPVQDPNERNEQTGFRCARKP